MLDFVGTLVAFSADREAGLQEVRAELTGLGASVDFAALEGAYLEARGRYAKVLSEQLVEVSSEVWIGDAMKLLGVEVDRSALKRLTEAYFRSYMKEPRVLPGTREALEYLRGKGYGLALVSNFSYSPAVEGVLKRFGLDDFFSVMAVSQTVGYRKPHQAIFRYALEGLGVEPRDTVMVGDTPTEDVYGAKRLGMRAFQIREALNQHYTPYSLGDGDSEEYLHPDGTIETLGELKRIL